MQRIGTTVSYVKNGATLYTSAVSSPHEVQLDVSLYDQNGSIQSARIAGAQVTEFWTEPVNVTVSANTITKSDGNYSWNADAISASTIPAGADGFVEATALETNSYRMFGLSDSNPDSNFQSIDHAVYLMVNGTVSVYENGLHRGYFGPYQVGDVFRVQRTESNVTYLKNGTVFYSSQIASTNEVHMDVSIYTPGGTVGNARLVNASPVIWQDPVNVSVNGNSLTKTAGATGWNADAVSTHVIPAGADGFVEATSLETTTNRMFGFSDVNSDSSYTSIDHAVFLLSAGIVQIYESGTHRHTSGAYTTGDVFRVQRTGSTVT